MKKKVLSLVLVFILASAMLAPTIASANGISVTIDGQAVGFSDQGPVIVDGRTLVPVRGVFEMLGFDVQWDGGTQTAMLSGDDHTVSITVGNAEFIANGQSYTLDVPAQIIGGRTMVPIRLPLESVGFGFDWDATARTVLIGTAQNDVDTQQMLSQQEAEESQQTEQQQPSEPEEQEQPPQPEQEHPEAQQPPQPEQEHPEEPEWQEEPPAQQLKSSITLPNRRLTDAERAEWIADYIALGGPTAVELEVVRLVNIERANHNLSPVEIDDALMMAARFFAQQAYDLQGLHTGTHNFGPYRDDNSRWAPNHGASYYVARAFGGRLRWGGGNWFSGGTMSAEALVNGWMNSDGHRTYILSPEHRFIGAGQFPGGISYLFLSDQRSLPTA